MTSDNLKKINFCPHCGDPDFSRGDSKAWRCNTCGFVYYQNSAAAVAAILHCRQEILLTVRKADPGKNMLDLPGGFVDPGESLEGALTREINEELKLHVHQWNFLFSYPNRYEYQGVIYDTTDAFFKSDFVHKPNTAAGDDVADIIWMPINDIDLSDIALNSIRKAIQHIKASQSDLLN